MRSTIMFTAQFSWLVLITLNSFGAPGSGVLGSIKFSRSDNNAGSFAVFLLPVLLTLSSTALVLAGLPFAILAAVSEAGLVDELGVERSRALEVLEAPP